MPVPPITIGELTDVPTFDSPIASPWAQEVTRRCAHRFASTTERDTKYPAASAGVGAVCMVGARLYRSDGTRWIADGEWSPITGNWIGFFGGAVDFDQWWCRVGDIVSVQFVVIVNAVGQAITGTVGFTPTNLPPAAGNVIVMETWTCNYRAAGGSRTAGMIIASGSGMGFSPIVAATGSGLGAPIGAVSIAAGVPMAWTAGASMTIAGQYRV